MDNFQLSNFESDCSVSELVGRLLGQQVQRRYKAGYRKQRIVVHNDIDPIKK